MASFTPNRSTMFFFLVILATVFVSAAGVAASDSEHGRVLEEDQNIRYRVDDSELPNVYYGICMYAREQRPCRRVMATIPDLKFKLSGQVELAELLSHVIANRTAEAKALADPLLAAAEEKGGKLPTCLVFCAESLDEVSEVMSGLPEDIDVEKYPKVQSFLRKMFESGADPPLCQRCCPDKTSTADEAAVAEKFHAIWALMDCAETLGQYYVLPPPPPPKR
uniref:Pectinesterase inhibitor domain-containing protein n=1 Tax=Oryza punctata TaxID=4537 RepID=A0A0E0MGG6_ORYPU